MARARLVVFDLPRQLGHEERIAFALHEQRVRERRVVLHPRARPGRMPTSSCDKRASAMRRVLRWPIT